MLRTSILLICLIFLFGCVEQSADHSNQRFYKVTRVVDGDTFWVDDNSRRGLKVRLIGVDAPETRKSEYKDIGFYGEESKQYLKNLLARQRVRFEFDVDSTDRYGRTLAYAFLPDGTFVNAELIKLGYAKVLTIPPNVAHADEFRDFQSAARGAKMGMWSQEISDD